MPFASIISNNLNVVMKRAHLHYHHPYIPHAGGQYLWYERDIPYQHTLHAFYIPVILSIAISVVISWYFMKKKWFLSPFN